MATPAETLKECLLSLSVRVREIRAISLIDQQGLPLVSSLGTGGLDESLAAFGGLMTRQMERAQGEFSMGPMYLAHFVGRDRQVFITPVNPQVALAAIVDAHATPATITMHLLALAREVQPHVQRIQGVNDREAEEAPG